MLPARGKGLSACPGLCSVVMQGDFRRGVASPQRQNFHRSGLQSGTGLNVREKSQLSGVTHLRQRQSVPTRTHGFLNILKLISLALL